MMHLPSLHPPEFRAALRREVSDWRPWATRLAVLSFAALAGLTVVTFAWLCEQAFALFVQLSQWAWWLPLVWTPICTTAVVALTRGLAPGAAGSGIPQVMAALKPGLRAQQIRLFVSLRLSVAKVGLTTLGLLGGLSLGREGPSVQVAAGVLHSVRHWLPRHRRISAHGLMVAGGAAGIAAAFNTPLGGIMFAIEELSGQMDKRNNGLLMAAIVLSGLMAVSIFGNATYFGVIRVSGLTREILAPGLLVTLVSGLAGGLFSRLLVSSLAGANPTTFCRLRQRHPLRFAMGCGLVVATLGVLSHGAVFGSGYGHTRAMLEGHDGQPMTYALFKFLATWITAWSGVPGGIFAPSLAIGAALGNDVAQWLLPAQGPTLIALGMAAFLAAATQAPLTAFIIVMEMVDGHALVLSLIASALTASAVSRLISTPLYSALTQIQWQRLAATGPAATSVRSS
jgi:H+/Cl- antiporter ClcA